MGGGGLFNVDTSSKAYDLRAGTSGSASPLAQHSGQATGAGALALRDKASYQEAGSAKIQDSAYAQVGGVRTGNVLGQVITNDPSIFRDSLAAVSRLNDSNAQSLTSVIRESQQSQESALDKVLALVESKTTDGLAKPLLVLGLAFLVVAGIFFWRRA